MSSTRETAAAANLAAVTADAVPDRSRESATTSIVLADDHTVIRNALRMLLDAEPGFEVVAEAGDADTALRYVRGHKPTVLLLDLNMPGRSSLEAVPDIREASPQTEIVGCWPSNSPVLQQCIQAGRVIDVPEQATVSESTAGGLEPESITLELCKNVIDRCVLVSETEILAAMRLILETEHWLIEGAAAVAVAAFLKEARGYAGKRAVIILCGRNVSPAVLTRLQDVV